MSRFSAVLALLVTMVALGTPLAAPSAAQGPVPGRPDALIRRGRDRALVGDHVYNREGTGQTRRLVVDPGQTARFFVQVQNDARTTADMRIVGTKESTGFRVAYSLHGRPISPPVKAGTFILHDLAPGAQRTIVIEVTPTSRAAPNSERRVVLSARDTVDEGVRDNVVAVTQRSLFTSRQREVLDQINTSRRQNGRGPVAMDRTLAAKAQHWAEHLAATNRLEHSNLSSGAPPGWQALAEDVGYGASSGEVHRRFMSSSAHRANILGSYNFVGTGYAVGHGHVWVVHEFMRR